MTERSRYRRKTRLLKERNLLMVFVLDKSKKPLDMITNAKARILLRNNLAIIQAARNYTITNIRKIIPDTTSHDAWLTKYNRDQLGLPKEHYYDALSVGEILTKFNFSTDKILSISAKGRGSRQMCRMNKYGFPRTAPKGSKSVKGFQTGDIVKAVVTKGKKQGTYLGRVITRSGGDFNIDYSKDVVEGISHKYCHLIQRCDGYSYSISSVI